jgi:phospholipase C
MSYLLDMNGVSWKYYIGNGNEPDCEDGGMTCPPTPQNPKVPSYWNPFGYFTTVASKVYGDGNYLADHVITNDQFFLDIQNGTLPAVSWLIPADIVSEHPAAGVQEGMEYVTSLVNAIMRTGQPGYKGVNYWSNTVIIITWDDWGGFYDHVPPPIADYLPNNGGVIGYGIRVPGLLISPYVKHGIDSQTLSFDHFNKLIEDLFMGHQRLDPALDGRADSRPTVREGIQTVTNPITQAPIQLGDLMNDFDFNQAPIPPLILTTEIPIGFVSTTSQKTGAPISSQWALVTLQNGTQATYNLYRTQTSGSGYQLVMGCSNAQAGGGGNLSTCNSTSGFSPVICCTDPNVTSGQEYYYVVTSVLNGVESLKSAELAVIAP